MRRKRYQAGGLTPPITGLGGRARLTGFQTGTMPRPGMTDPTVLSTYVPPPPPENTILQLSEQERAELLAASQQELPYGGVRPDDWLQGLIYDGFKGLRDQSAAKLAASDPAPGTTGGAVDPFLGGDRSGLGQVGGLEEIVQRYETPRTSDVEPGVERVPEPAAPSQPLGGYQTPSSLLEYIEHMKEKSAAPQEMQYGGTPMPWHGAPPQQAQLQAGPAKSVSMGQPPGGGMGIQAGPLPPGMGPGSGGGPMAPGGSPFDMGQLRGPMGGGMPGRQPRQGGLGQLMQQRQQMMQQRQQRQGAMGRRGRGPPPRRMMPQRPQAMGQPPGGGAGGGGGMPGGPRVPPNLRGMLQRQQMDNRPAPGPGGNRIGGGDQRGAMARARQSQTGRPPISRRSAFPGRDR